LSDAGVFAVAPASVWKRRWRTRADIGWRLLFFGLDEYAAIHWHSKFLHTVGTTALVYEGVP